MNNPSSHNSLDRALLHDYVDDQLDDQARVAVARHLGQNPWDADLVSAYRKQNEVLQSAYAGIAEEPIPQRLLDTANEFSGKLPKSSGQRRHFFEPVAAAAVVCLMVGGLAGWWLGNGPQGRGWRPSTQTAFVDQAVRSYQLYASGNASARSGAIGDVRQFAQWFEDQFKTHVLAPSLQSIGLQLDDARILPASQGTAGELIYHDGHGTRIGLYIRVGASEGYGAAGTKMAADELSRGKFSRHKKLMAFYWQAHDAAYALIGPMKRDQLQQLAESILNLSRS